MYFNRQDEFGILRPSEWTKIHGASWENVYQGICFYLELTGDRPDAVYVSAVLPNARVNEVKRFGIEYPKAKKS